MPQTAEETYTNVRPIPSAKSEFTNVRPISSRPSEADMASEMSQKALSQSQAVSRRVPEAGFIQGGKWVAPSGAYTSTPAERSAEATAFLSKNPLKDQTVVGSMLPAPPPTQPTTFWSRAGNEVGNLARGAASPPNTPFGNFADPIQSIKGGAQAVSERGTEFKQHPAAATAATLTDAAAIALPFIAHEAISRTSPGRAIRASGIAYENAVAPGSISAEEQAAMRSDWERARKYIGSETATAAVEKGEGAGMRSAATARKAANKLWSNNVEPVISKFSEESGSTKDIAKKIRDSVTDIDKARPGSVGATNRFASLFDKDMTVREMQTKVTELNNDKAVSRFYDMSPAEQSQAMAADRALRGKVVALDALRDKMFDTIGDHWTESGADAFREARRDYGSLRNVESNFRNMKVPTPATLPQRAANTVRSFISPKHAGVTDTLGRFNNPNRLAARAVNKAAGTGEAIPAPPALPSYSRPAGPAAAQALPTPPVPPQTPVGTLPPLGFPTQEPGLWRGTDVNAGNPPAPRGAMTGEARIPNPPPNPSRNLWDVPEVQIATTPGRPGSFPEMPRSQAQAGAQIPVIRTGEAVRNAVNDTQAAQGAKELQSSLRAMQEEGFQKERSAAATEATNKERGFTTVDKRGLPKPPSEGKAKVIEPVFYRSEAAPLARKYGLISREPSAPGLVSFQDSTTGGSIEMKDGFTEQQLADKVKAHRDAMAATGPSGKSDLQAAKRAAAENRFAHEAAPASGIVKTEFGKLKIYDLVTPRQQKTLETMMRGPRWAGMDSVDKSSAISNILKGTTIQ